jgi:hypothetical protein
VKFFHLVVRLNTMASHLSYDKIQSVKSCQRLADFPKREAAATGDQMRKLQLFVLLLALVIGQGAKWCLAQSPNLAFDAASIKRSKNVNSRALHGGVCNAIDHKLTAGPITPGLGRCVFTGAALRMIIRSAFGIDLVEGGPSWIGADEFEIEAKAEDPATAMRDQMSQIHSPLFWETVFDRSIASRENSCLRLS